VKQKRLLILSSEFPPGPGGIGTHAFQVANALHNTGWQVKVLTPQDYASKDEIINFNNRQPFKIESLATHRSKPIQTWQRFWGIRNNLRKFKPDLVMATGSRAAWIAGLLASGWGLPWVLIGHGSEFGITKSWQRRLMHFSANRADTIIAVSQYTQRVMENMGITNPPCTVIHNGADHRQFHQLSKTVVEDFRRNEAVEKLFVLLTVGNVSDRKGQEVVIKALPEITAFVPNVIYWMAGLPQNQAKLRSLARELGVADHIRFWGRVSNETLLHLYNACDLFIMTSRQCADGDFEGYGIAVIEAALCGKTAVVSKNSGLAEAVEDGVTGLLVPQNDPEQTAHAILNLINNPNGRQELEDQAHENACANQTWEKVGARYVEIFEELLTRTNQAKP